MDDQTSIALQRLTRRRALSRLYWKAQDGQEKEIDGGFSKFESGSYWIQRLEISYKSQVKEWSLEGC